MPLHEFVRDPVRLASLRRGIAVMKARKPSDPRSLFFQAAVHGVRPERVTAAAQQDPAVAKVDQVRFWNRCPHYAHTQSPSADFLPWHRAYLYYFERILRDAAGDDGLSLPYWDYSSAPELAFIPAAFRDPEPDAATGEPTNPLYHAERAAGFGAGREPLTLAAVSLDALKKSSFFGPNQLGGMWNGAAVKGELDKIPHGRVHTGIGGGMNDFRRAAFDPLFWVHHCNVDRLWAHWDKQPGKQWGDAPPASWFAEQPWWFHDVDGKPVNPPRAHFLQRKWLPVAYDVETGSEVALSEDLPKPQSVLDLGEVLASRNTTSLLGNLRITEIASAAGALALDADGPSSARLSGTAEAEQAVRVTVLKSRLARPAARTERFVFLELAGIPADPPPGVGFDVHLNLAPGAVPDRASPSFVGTLDLFGTSGHDDHGAHRTELFDITGQALNERLGSAAQVTLVPFALLGGDQPLPSPTSMRVDQVRIFIAVARRR
jgi:tyrosinase